jgi:uncharacterized delta-60 repeat protein
MSHGVTTRAAVVACLVAAILFGGAIAASGRFDSRGRALLKGLASEEALAYPGGRTLLVGFAQEEKHGILRLRRDGSRDTSFGDRGFVPGAFIRDVLVLKNGKILIAGEEAALPVLTRLRADGSPDPAFGAGGSRFVNLGEPDSNFVNVLARGPRGTVLLGGGWVENPGSRGGESVTPLVARAQADGRLDRSFGGGDGIVAMEGFQQVSGLSSAPGGSVLVLGSDIGTYRVRRLRSNGSPDRSFADGGVLQIAEPAPPGTREPFLSLVPELGVMSDGRIVVAGGIMATVPGETLDHSSVVERYLPSGRPDTSFGEGGIVQIVEPGWEFPRAFAVRRDGTIAVAGQGRLNPGDEADFVATVLRRDGRRYGRIGSRGRVVVDFGGFDYASSVIFRGRWMLLVGPHTSETAGDLGTGLARFRLPRRVR